MDQVPRAPSRVIDAEVLFAGLAIASAAAAVVLARDGSGRTAVAVILAVVVGFCAGSALRLLDHVRLPTWVGIGGIPAALFITTLDSPSDRMLAMYLAGFGGFSLSLVVRRWQQRGRSTAIVG
jgi:hypothetical protein